MATWPDTVPMIPLVDSYSETPPDVVIRTTMDAGPAKVRRRFSAGVRNFTFSLHLTGEQLVAFDDFFNDDLIGGAVSFDFVSPRTGENTNMRMTAPPQYRARGGNVWSVNLSMEEMP